jgi:hypothetical protein
LAAFLFGSFFLFGAGCGGGQSANQGPTQPLAQNTAQQDTASGGGYLDAISRARQSAQRLETQNNLLQIGTAFHIYHDAYNYLPLAAISDKQGKPLLSWRVALLPYLEEQALYAQFKQDEPWDSPHNKKLLDKMPKIYRNPRFQQKEDKVTVTYFQGFVGTGGVLAGTPAPLTLEAITNVNGASNTCLVVEAGDPVPWTKPEDLVHDPKKPLPPLGGPSRGNFLALFADRHVQLIPANTPEKIIRCMIQWNNTEAFRLP